MELSLLLAQVMGAYLILEGLVILLRRKFVVHIINDLRDHKGLMFITGAMVFILGLLVVLNHNVWEATWRVVPTIIGWVLVVKGILAFFVPGMMLSWGSKVAGKRNMAVLMGVVAIAIGAYLAYIGFGLGA